MMAASPQVTMRLDEGTYKALVKLAELDRKTIADVTRELIQIGLGRRKRLSQSTCKKYEKSQKRQDLKMAELEAEVKRSRRMAAAGMYWTQLLWRDGLPKEAHGEAQSAEF